MATLKQEMWVLRKVKIGVDRFGTEVYQAQWFKEKEDINFGSIKDPQNEDVIRVEFRDPNSILKAFGDPRFR